MALTEKQLNQRRAAGKSRARSFTSEYQKAARAKMPQEAVERAARAGFRAVCERKGGFTRNRMFERAIAYRLEHPSRPEQIVDDVLGELLIGRWREHRLCKTVYRTADFFLPELRAVIQVHGGQHYTRRGDETEAQFAARLRADRLTRNAARRAGYIYVEIDARGTLGRIRQRAHAAIELVKIAYAVLNPVSADIQPAAVK